MKILIIGDIHIDDEYIEEQSLIIDEICQYKADICIQLGDFYNSRQPTPKSLDFGTFIAKKLKENFKKVIILTGTGTHDLLNGISITNYLSKLDIEIKENEYQLNVDNHNYLFGHFFLYESKLAFGKYKYKLSDINYFDYVFLGHSHSPEDINDKCFHVGSIFYQTFKEKDDEFKRICLLDTENNLIEWKELKSPVKMKEVNTLEELEEYKNKYKVRLKINDFNYYKENISKLKEYRNKYYKLEFSKEDEQYESKEKINDIKEILIQEIEKLTDLDVKKVLKDVL